MTKLAPVRMVSLVLGVWFLSMALGNKLAGVLGSRFHGHRCIRAGVVLLLAGRLGLRSPRWCWSR